MREKLESLLAKAQKQGASYADVRFVERDLEPIAVKNGAVDRISRGGTSGVGLRVLVNGGWGYAAASSLDDRALSALVERAISIGRASARVQEEPVDLAPVDAHEAVFKTKPIRDPADVTIEDRLELLFDTVKEMQLTEEVVVAEASLSVMKERKTFASTEGSLIQQDIIETGAGLSAVAKDGREVQRRSFRDYTQGGFEFIDALDMPSLGESLGSEAAELLSAPNCPTADMDIVLGSSQLALQVHESCGHPIELDRVLGQEASFAGTSFLTPDRLGSFQYGSEAVNITADATSPGGLGTFAYDDEGVPGQATKIIDNGLFVNYLTSRETASLLPGLAGEAGRSASAGGSNGTMRAEGWWNLPMVRMTNINLDPGGWTLDEIIKDTKQGMFLETPRSWSLDDKRLNFHFSTEVAYEIVDGERGQLMKGGSYTDMTPRFWNSCDAVAGQDDWHLWGMPSCAKGEPIQIAHVSHGAAPARFRKVKVGARE